MRRIPRWGKVLIGVFGLVLIAALALPYVLDVDRYRPDIIAALEGATGRKATIGKLRARFLPTIGFTIDDVRLSSPASFGEHQLVTIGTIRGSLAWKPLLHRELKVSGVQLIRAKVQLITDAGGRTNYDFSSPPPPPSSTASAAEQSSSSSFALADIDSVDIKDAELVVAQLTRDHVLAPSLHASHLTVHLTDLPLASSLTQWQGSMNMKGVRLEAPGFAPVEFTSGEVKLVGRALAAQFATALGKAAEISGTVRVEDLEKPVVRFELKTAVLNLAEIGSIGAGAPSATPAPRAPIDRKVSAPNPSTLRTTTKAPRQLVRASELVAEGRVIADRVRLAPLEGTAAQLDIRIFADRVELSPFTVQLYDGTIDVTALLDTAAVPAALDARIDIRRVNIGKLVAATAPQSPMTGTGELTLQLAGALGNDVLASIVATGKAAARNGAIPGFEMNGVMGQVARIGSFGRLGKTNDKSLASEIPYASITADLSVASSRVNSRHVHMDSSAGTVEMRGWSSFDQKMDYEGEADFLGGPDIRQDTKPQRKGLLGAFKNLMGVAAKQTIGRVHVPFTVRGSFGSPHVSAGIGITGLTHSGNR